MLPWGLIGAWPQLSIISLFEKGDREDFLDVFEVAVQGEDFTAEFLGDDGDIAVEEMDRLAVLF